MLHGERSSMHGGTAMQKQHGKNTVMYKIILLEIKLVVGKVMIFKANPLFKICELLWSAYFVCFLVANGKIQSG